MRATPSVTGTRAQDQMATGPVAQQLHRVGDVEVPFAGLPWPRIRGEVLFTNASPSRARCELAHLALPLPGQVVQP